MTDTLTKTLRSSFLIIAFSLLLSLNAKAQTCGTPPSCDSLGYTQTVADCGSETKALKCPFDTSKMFCVTLPPIPCKPEVGSIYYSDKSCSKTVTAGKTAIGIIFDTNKRLAVALDQPINTMAWGGYGTDIPTLTNCGSNPFTCDTDGKANTSAIIAYGKANSISYPAAEYCNSYTTVGTTAGDWFLPSYADLMSIYNAKTYVNASLQLLGKSALTENYYWSSTEYDNDYSWVLIMNNGNYYTNYKKYSYYVRAVVAF